MLIYAVADIHSRSEKIALIGANIEHFSPDLLIAAGDIINFRRPHGFISRLNKLPVPVLLVRGNTDPARIERILDQYSNVTSLHMKEIVIGEIPFVGVSGTVPIPFSSRVAFREKKLLNKLGRMIHRNSILVAHTPPKEILDKAFGRFHVGSRGLRNLVAAKSPAMLICGHIHENTGVVNIGNTIVVNCSIGHGGKGALIKIEKNCRPEVRML